MSATDTDEPARTIDLAAKLQEFKEAIVAIGSLGMQVPAEAYELVEITARALFAEQQLAALAKE